jgi:hypothetical protein
MNECPKCGGSMESVPGCRGKEKCTNCGYED